MSLTSIAPSRHGALALAALLIAAGACRGSGKGAGKEGESMTEKSKEDAVAGAAGKAGTEKPQVESQFEAWQRVEEQMANLKQEKIEWNSSILDEKQKQMLRKLLEAAAVMDELFLGQVSIRNTQIRADLEAAADPKANVIKRYFKINFGPYDRFDENRPFINVPLKPPGATFYPQNMTKDEFNAWIEAHPKDKEKFVNNFTIITRDKEGLKAVPYSEFYKEPLTKAAGLLNEAAALSDNPSLARYLRSRAKAFLGNDYYASDVDWMDVKDNLIDVTIGPYETYEDVLFGYKAAFEAFICLKDPEASEKLGQIKAHVPEMEEALPLDAQYKTAKAGKESPISVVDVIFTAGDSKAGVQTIAFNLPNDEKVRTKKGSKKVLLRNFITAKYEGILVPIGKVVISPAQQQYIAREEFFNHTLLHEISHGIGPGFITKSGKKTEVRVELRDLYSAVEEAKADVLGMWSTLFLQKKGFYPAGTDRKMWVTFLASIFRSIRFGADEAHGKANVLILNYLLAKGGYRYDEATSTFSVDFEAIEKAVTDLAGEILLIEAKGDYDGAAALLNTYGILTNSERQTLDKLAGIPVDIEPVFDLEF